MPLRNVNAVACQWVRAVDEKCLRALLYVPDCLYIAGQRPNFPVRLSYFLAIEQYFPLTTFQYKHQHKPNFSISKQVVYCYECSGVNVLAKVPRDTEK